MGATELGFRNEVAKDGNVAMAGAPYGERAPAHLEWRRPPVVLRVACNPVVNPNAGKGTSL